jgi:hypothetical protein
MNKKILIALLILVFIGGLIFLVKQFSSPKKVSNLNKAEEKVSKDLGLKEEKRDIPSYPQAIVDEDKCGKDAFYVEEKSADFVKNYCRFLKDNGWKLVHQDYSDCEEIKSFGGGYNYEKGQEKVSISVIKYGEDATCFWVYKK